MLMTGIKLQFDENIFNLLLIENYNNETLSPI